VKSERKSKRENGQSDSHKKEEKKLVKKNRDYVVSEKKTVKRVPKRSTKN